MKPIKVFYDHQIFSLQRYGGISRYFTGLIKEFQKTEDIDVSVGGWISDNQYLKSLNVNRRILPPFLNKVKRGSTFFLNSFSDFVWNHKSNIYHPTYYYPVNFRKKSPLVVTVFDMIHEKFPQEFSKNDPTTYWKKKLVKQACRIIAISENTKKDLVELFSVSPDKIDVVYLSSELSLEKNRSDNLNLPENYIFFVGNRSGYKNFNLLIQAVSRIINKYPDFNLVLGGGGPLSKEEMNQINNLGILENVIQKNLSDSELVTAYEKAICFVFPSLYEGFGIPILEAFQCQCPVVLSQFSSFPEVAGEAAEFFDPYSIDSIEMALLKVIEDPMLRKNLKIQGLDRIKKFSQRKVARDTLKVYHNVL